MNKIKLICKNCGTEFERPRSIVFFSYGHYCSKKCKYTPRLQNKFIKEAEERRNIILDSSPDPTPEVPCGVVYPNEWGVEVICDRLRKEYLKTCDASHHITQRYYPARFASNLYLDIEADYYLNKIIYV